MADGLFAAALRGDVMKKLDTGGLFDCDDPAVDGPRVARFEISPAGPMFGHKLRPAGHDALAREERLLAAEGIALPDFARGGGEAEGTRRAARLRAGVAVEPLADGGGYRAEFELPKGSYATVVMRELVKGGAAAIDEADEG
jgi:tRNA pseudouridine13 synthase